MSPGFTLMLKKNPTWQPDGPKDYARSVRKWNVKPTDQTTFYTHETFLMRRISDPAPDEKRSCMSWLFSGKKTKKPVKVPAEDVQNDLEYVVPVTIGTPGVTLNLDFDTGSADLWVWSSLLSANKATLKKHNIYRPSKSKGAKKAKRLTWSIIYHDESFARGMVYTDTVKLDTLSISNQAIEVASKLSPAFMMRDESDGLLGLAFSSINTVKPTPQKTPMENMIAQRLISRPLFTVKLNKGDSSGFYTFGYIDRTIAGDVSAIRYTPIDSSKGFWEFPSTTLRIGRRIVQRASGNTAIADTGTTLILLDDAACSAIYGSISGATHGNSQGGWTLPSNATDLPSTISFAVGNYMYSIPGIDLLFADAGDGRAYGSIQSRGQNSQDILGDVFLKRVYAIFDQTPGAPKIGFVQRTK